jgi:perosamine synthetase
MILVNAPRIAKNTKKYLNECIDTNWVSGEGPFVQKFEKAFAEKMDVPFGLTTNSGTAALHLALATLDIGIGDEVILPASTMGACYFAIWYCGAKAVPVDVDPQTYTIDVSKIEAAITKRTKAIMAVHLFGHPCDMDALVKVKEKHNLWLIEDCAEAHGAKYKSKTVGSFGDFGCYSFYGNKIITTGEGGMLTTKNAEWYEKAKRLKTFNFSPTKRFTHLGMGYRYTMTNLQAAVGLAQLEELDKALKLKRKMAKFYQKALADIPGIILPTEKKNCESVFWMYAILIKEKEFGMSRDEVMKKLQDDFGIQTRSFFFSPKEAFAETHIFDQTNFPVAEIIGREGLYLPSGLGNTMQEFQAVADAIHQLVSSHR